MSSKDDKLKALKMTMDRLEKSYGKGIVMKLGDKPVVDAPATSYIHILYYIYP